MCVLFFFLHSFRHERAGRSRRSLWTPRKVRAPQGKTLRNAKAGQPDGKWHRNDTAYVPSGTGKGEKVR